MTPWVCTLAAAMALSVAPAAQAQGSTQKDAPLQMVDGRLVTTVMTADGTPLEFLINTGANETALSEQTVARFGTDVALRLGTHDVAQEGRETWRDAALEVGGKVYDGQIGVNTLGDFDVLLDVPGGRLRLGPLGSASTWEDVTLADPIRVRIMHGTAVMFDANLDGQTYPAVLDLSTPTLIVNSGVEKDLGLEATDQVTLTLAGTTLPEMPVRVMALDIFEMWSPNGDGVVVVGSAALSACPIALSWARAELRMCAP